MYADYGELNQTEGVTGEPMDAVERHHGPGLDGKTLTTDGPFADAKEAMVAFVLRGRRPGRRDRSAAKVPAASMGGAIEVRPVEEYG